MSHDFEGPGATPAEDIAIEGATVEEIKPPEYKSFGDFEMGDAGLFYVETKTNKDGKKEEKRTWLSSPFEVLAETRDKGSESWGKLLRWRDPDGVTHEWAMPNAMLGGSREDIFRALFSGGLRIASSQALRNHLGDYLASVHVSGRARAVDRIGWHQSGGRMAFVLPGHVIGEADERILLQTETRVEVPYHVAGTAEAWRDEIGRLCIGNSRLTFSVALAFAPALLSLAEEEGGGFHWHGDSRIGKSTLLHAAGSVWGGGRVNGFLDTWKATANGLEGIAAGHCDALLCLDEMGQVPRPEEVGEVAYMLANGAGKARASRSGAARRRAEWRTLFLSSGEITLADKLAEAGKRPRAGQEVRLVDIPADAGAGFGVFEELHGSPSAGAFAERIKGATARFYGAPIRRFLEMLAQWRASDPAGMAERLRVIREGFLAAHLPAGASGQARTVCTRFALAAAGGSLATAWGLTGWPDDAAEKAAGTCFAAWLAQRGSAGNSEIDIGIRQVIAFIEMHGSSRFEDAWAERPERIVNCVGFRRREGEGENATWQFMVLSEMWRAEVCKGFDAAALAREMVRRGLLMPGDGRNVARKVSVPNHGTVRLYCLCPDILGDQSADALKPVGNVGTVGNGLISNGNPTSDSPKRMSELSERMAPKSSGAHASSDISDTPKPLSEPQNPSKSAAVPTFPTFPTQNGMSANVAVLPARHTPLGSYVFEPGQPPAFVAQREPGEDEDDGAPPGPNGAAVPADRSAP